MNLNLTRIIEDFRRYGTISADDIYDLCDAVEGLSQDVERLENGTGEA